MWLVMKVRLFNFYLMSHRWFYWEAMHMLCIPWLPVRHVRYVVALFSSPVTFFKRHCHNVVLC